MLITDVQPRNHTASVNFTYPVHCHNHGTLLPAATGKIKWRAEFRSMASPALRLVASGHDDPGQSLAVFLKSGRSPRVFALRERHKLVQAVQAAALARLGITLAGVCREGQRRGGLLMARA